MGMQPFPTYTICVNTFISPSVSLPSAGAVILKVWALLEPLPFTGAEALAVTATADDPATDAACLQGIHSGSD